MECYDGDDPYEMEGADAPGTVNFTERGEQRGRSVTRGEKQERRKETRCLLYAAIRCAINPRNIDIGQELSGGFLIVIRYSIKLHFINLSYFWRIFRDMSVKGISKNAGKKKYPLSPLNVLYD